MKEKKPEVQKVTPKDYTGVDIRFYTETYKITAEKKRMLVELVKKPEFRVFEEYLDWRVNAAAHRMKALLKERKDNEAANEAAEIDALVKITQDMQNYWGEVKLMDVENDLLIKEKNSVSPKVFGTDRFSIDQSNEAVSV